MARYTGPSCRQCRREGQKLYLKGERCYSEKCALTRRKVAPGQHGAQRVRNMSDFGLQLREKQKVKRYYGMLEKQFRATYESADKSKEVTGDKMIQLLESRLDNVVFRMGLANSRKEARQLVTHGHFTLNGKKAYTPSIQVKMGDVVAVKEKSKNSAKFKALREAALGTPKWVETDLEKLQGEVTGVPTMEDVDIQIETHLIIELYSR